VPRDALRDFDVAANAELPGKDGVEWRETALHDLHPGAAPHDEEDVSFLRFFAPCRRRRASLHVPMLHLIVAVVVEEADVKADR